MVSIGFFIWVDNPVVTKRSADPVPTEKEQMKGNKNMKKKFSAISNRTKLVGINRMSGREEVVDYYLVSIKGDREYAFTRKYTRATYDLVKGGISVKQLMQVRTKDKMVMRLVKYVSLMMPYFMEEIDWMVA